MLESLEMHKFTLEPGTATAPVLGTVLPHHWTVTWSKSQFHVIMYIPFFSIKLWIGQHIILPVYEPQSYARDVSSKGYNTTGEVLVHTV